ncbi:putative Zn-finger protein [Paenibacillus castaneae]|nr:putative Zn-finger protein [Paenibacillus castaneae]
MNPASPIAMLIQIILPMGLAFLFVYKYIDIRTKTTHFVCPVCSCSFKLSKLNFAFALKTGLLNERIVTCPVCGYRGRMPVVKD